MRTVQSSVSKMLLFVFLSLTLVALTQTPVVDAKDLVTRPFHISGLITISPDGFSVISDEGVATHLGRFGLIDQDIDTYIYTYGAANGDQISWQPGPYEFDPATGIITGSMEFTGGTGRFEGVEGSFEYSWDFWTGLYTGKGAIAY